MEDKFVRELKLLLKRLQEEDSFLKVKWETGGDEQFINFDFSGQTQASLEQYKDMLDALRDRLIDKFDLPDASAYYNNGFARFFLSKENQVMIEYTEMEVEYDIIVKEVFNRNTPTICFKTTELMREFLVKEKMSTLYYEAEIDYDEKKTYLSIGKEVYFDSIKDKSDQLLKELEFFLTKVISSDLKNNSIRVSGVIDERYVSFRDLYIMENKIFKDNKNETMVFIS